MKFKNYTLLALLMLLISGVSAQNLTVATFNLRMDNAGDVGNLWTARAPIVASLIRFHDFDIMGTQEGFPHQLNDITTALPEYQRYGVGRDDGSDKGEHSAIFFKKDRFKLLNKGDFWLSQTPEKPSLGWDATCCNRICSWVQLQDLKSKKKFFVFNVHYDHQAMVAREESSKLILQRIKIIAGGQPVILTGDFNGDNNSSWYKRVATSSILKDTYEQAAHPYTNNGTFNDFGRNIQSDAIIDHIFTTSAFKVERWGILSDSYHGKYPSDHFPVMTKLTF
ncbi:endonuclease/exonuclease/phosphatase family protein [Mucilaginibacter sp. Bleaf8]|uniref:endonuclease/exonuclease/phosphatase family protein n=1 Tax=Mucilaginibacter sp. Bleaf8 TaxID=2834430 RepID=UPI001BCF619A|nr:endonuclease/exonuclease/phosphatase family protein [Mucilaginibacter sp. Bleaf8]MBS7564383.1 endonuclease/exonuclease/phosphatase family protein [Mucilaginibacter sp. Bleaf8]